MKRSKSFIKKPVMVITDQPVISEIETDTPYSAASNLELLDDLNKVGIPQNIINKNVNPITITKIIQASYLLYFRPDKGIKTQFVRKNSSIPEGENYIEVPFQKNLWVEEKLWLEVLDLIEEIRRVQPKIIITTGKWVFFFLYGYYEFSKTAGTATSKTPLGGLSKHRGSLDRIHPYWELPNVILYPLTPVTFKYRNFDSSHKVKTERAYTSMVWDYKKIGKIFREIYLEGKEVSSYLNPKRNMIIGDSLPKIRDYMELLLTFLSTSKVRVAVDIECRYFTKKSLAKTASKEVKELEDLKRGVIDCIGFCYEKNISLAIPLSLYDNPLPWSLEEEVEITNLIRLVLTHQNTEIVGQNYNFDSQYINKFYLIDRPAKRDTMITSHILYNTLPKDLAYISSIYCENYSYWKTMESQEMENK